jgi:hypothetical protein
VPSIVFTGAWLSPVVVQSTAVAFRHMALAGVA